MSAGVRGLLWYIALFGLGVLPWALLVIAVMGAVANAEAEAFGDEGDIPPLTDSGRSAKVSSPRGVEQRQLVGLITRRSEVRILPPQPIASS